jgi:4-hydroxybenzoate polyprenyltransferase
MNAPSLGAKVVGLIQLVRPRQWVKNVFVFAPLVFAREFGNLASIELSLLAFALFCAASSACYIVNDLHDIERDRRHPTKRLSRPLAAGRVSRGGALALLGVVLAGLAVAAVFQPLLMTVIAGYLALNVAYTFVLKHQPVLDIFSIAIGFVLRIWAGAVVIDVPLSGWMQITTLCLALYLAAVKRRQELLGSGSNGREVLDKYSPALIERYAEMSATGALVFYSLFVMSANQKLTATIPLVNFGLSVSGTWRTAGRR